MVLFLEVLRLAVNEFYIDRLNKISRIITISKYSYPLEKIQQEISTILAGANTNVYYNENASDLVDRYVAAVNLFSISPNSSLLASSEVQLGERDIVTQTTSNVDKDQNDSLVTANSPYHESDEDGSNDSVPPVEDINIEV